MFAVDEGYQQVIYGGSDGRDFAIRYHRGSLRVAETSDEELDMQGECRVFERRRRNLCELGCEPVYTAYMFTSLVLRKDEVWRLLTKALHTPSKFDPPRALSVSPLQSDNPPNDVIQHAHGEGDTRTARKEQDILVPSKIEAHPSIRTIDHDHDPSRSRLRARPFLSHRVSRELDITRPRKAIQRTRPISNNPRTQHELAIRMGRRND